MSRKNSLVFIREQPWGELQSQLTLSIILVAMDPYLSSMWQVVGPLELAGHDGNLLQVESLVTLNLRALYNLTFLSFHPKPPSNILIYEKTKSKCKKIISSK